jgi:hypothetical protein
VVAAIAGILLLVSIGVDAAMNRTWSLDVQTPDGWRTVGTTGSDGGRPYAEPVYGGTLLNVSRNGTVHMRVTVDNGYPWSYADTYRVIINGAEVTRGTLQAASRGSGTSEFDVPARFAFDAAAPVPGGPAKTAISSLYVEVRIGSQSLYGNVALQEAPQ